jgi:RsiW-degrading membrane proteinase PrsW (M82 family)
MLLGKYLLALFIGGWLIQSCYAGDGQPPPHHVVLFMFFGIGLGILFVQALNYWGNPVHYTVCMFFAGMLFSLANNAGKIYFRTCLRFLF